jgi:tetratricopeptide (TPR) repeat protein
MILFIGCKNHSTNTAVTETDPIFQNDPKLKNITQQIHNSPTDAALYYERGTMLYKMQLDTLALNDYKKASSLDTNNAAYYSAVGDLLFENKDINGSVQWIQKAIAKDPTDRKAHLKVAKLFLYIKDYGKAFAEINTVLRTDVHNPEAYFLKGMVYKDMKDTAKAISNFETSVQESPDYRPAVEQLGLMYSAEKKPIALQYLDNAYRMDTTNVFPIFAKGVYYQDAKNDAAAKEAYIKCIMKDRHYADAYFNMGYMLMQEDSVAKAWRQYNIVTHIDPANPTAYYDRGLCSELMDSIRNAVADYKQAYLLDTSYKSPKAALKRLKVMR